MSFINTRKAIFLCTLALGFTLPVLPSFAATESGVPALVQKQIDKALQRSNVPLSSGEVANTRYTLGEDFSSFAQDIVVPSLPAKQKSQYMVISSILNIDVGINVGILLEYGKAGSNQWQLSYAANTGDKEPKPILVKPQDVIHVEYTMQDGALTTSIGINSDSPTSIHFGKAKNPSSVLNAFVAFPTQSDGINCAALPSNQEIVFSKIERNKIAATPENWAKPGDIVDHSQCNLQVQFPTDTDNSLTFSWNDPDAGNE